MKLRPRCKIHTDAVVVWVDGDINVWVEGETNLTVLDEGNLYCYEDEPFNHDLYFEVVEAEFVEPK